MNIIELIIKKREGKELNKEELENIISGYLKGDYQDYQISALLMAIVFRGMNKEETASLTDAMIKSGEVIDLSGIQGIKVDKHSTGGVGDKTTLVLGPLVASCGVKVAKMSGRGLGHTGGTLDKLESIPGFRIELSKEEFVKQVNEISIAVVGQTSNLVPADKKLYALRDVTGTVESLPLIASSIMSKKIATGSNAILLDVKFGNGAFMKTKENAIELAKAMCEIGKHLGRDTRAMITDMSQPLGYAIGNINEVEEAVNTLKGNGPKDLVDLCLKAGAIMLLQAGVAKTEEEGISLLKSKIDSLEAFNKLKEMVTAQGGDSSYLDDFSKFKQAKHQVELKATSSGYLSGIDALTLGESAMLLGAGRAKKEDLIDESAGITLTKKVGDYIEKDQVIAKIFTDKENYQEIIAYLNSAFTYSNKKPEMMPLVHHLVM